MTKDSNTRAEAVLEVIASRKSVRDYEARPVPEEMIDTLLHAAMAAPTAKNRQPWEFVVVREREVLDSLADGLPYAKMLFKAPLAIVVCAADEQFWEQDCAAATENLLLAAEAMGLGAVWTAAADDARAAVVRRVLGVPEEVKPFCVIPVGFPAEDKKEKDKWKPEKVHQEKW